MDAVDTGYIYHKRRNVRQQVNTKNKKTAAARPQGGGRRRLSASPQGFGKAQNQGKKVI